jgi:hypothetical protein
MVMSALKPSGIPAASTNLAIGVNKETHLGAAAPPI